jgi:hypothetical protein
MDTSRDDVATAPQTHGNILDHPYGKARDDVRRTHLQLVRLRPDSHSDDKSRSKRSSA